MTFISNKQFLKYIMAGVLMTLTACVAAPTSAPPPTDQKAANSPNKQRFDAVIGVIASVPETADSAETLGTHRLGSGVLIGNDGLVLTIGYLIMEAETAAIIASDERNIAADIIAFDPETGFGLLRAQQPIDATPMKLGNSKTLQEGTPVLAVSHGGKIPVIAARVVSQRPFAGGWEYLIDDAIFTTPPLREYGGAALIDSTGHLIGIGSLMVNDAVPSHQPVIGNMFVPVDILKPVINQLIATGRRASPGAPWLGVRIDEAQGRVFITQLTVDGPGENAGLEPGDMIVGVNGRRVRNMEDYLRKVRAFGRAGDDIPLDVVPRTARDLTIQRVVVSSIDRNDRLH